jgi:spore germination protein GerM
MAIRNQIERTLLQFDDINEVVISINGESEEILQP